MCVARWTVTTYAFGARKILMHVRDSLEMDVFIAVLIMFCHDCSLAVKPASTPWRLLPKQTWRDSILIDTLLSAASLLAFALPSSEIPEGLVNCLVCIHKYVCACFLYLIHFDSLQVQSQHLKPFICPFFVSNLVLLIIHIKSSSRSFTFAPYGFFPISHICRSHHISKLPRCYS
jgi:hypothetical protein